MRNVARDPWELFFLIGEWLFFIHLDCSAQSIHAGLVGLVKIVMGRSGGQLGQLIAWRELVKAQHQAEWLVFFRSAATSVGNIRVQLHHKGARFDL